MLNHDFLTQRIACLLPRPHQVRVGVRACSLLSLAVLLAACSSAPMRQTAGSGYRTHPWVERSAGQEEITIEAMGLVGTPYRYGGNTPASGFDCSGLVRYVVRHAAGVDLPRTTAEMSSVGEPIDPSDLASGDLVFFNTTGRPHSHVGIYVGQGQFVHAPSTGGTVRLANMSLPYWAKRFDGVRRVASNRAPAETGVLIAQPQQPTPAPASPPASSPPPALSASPDTSAQAVVQPAAGQSPVAASGNPDDDPIARFANF